MDSYSDESSETASPPSRSKRRWFQFSLRTLLIAVALLAVTVGLPMRYVHQQREIVRYEKEAVAEIKKLGGFVDYAESRPVLASTPAWLRPILGEEEYQSVKAVALDNT